MIVNQNNTDIMDELYFIALLISIFSFIFYNQYTLMIVASLITLVLISKLVAGKLLIAKNHLSFLILLQAGMFILSCFISPNQIQSYQKIWIFLSPLICFLVLSIVPIAEDKVRLMLSLFVFLVTIHLINQLVFYGETYSLLHRLTYYGNPIIFGQVISMTCILLVIFISNDKINIGSLIFSICLLIGLIGLFLTYSRGAWLGFIAFVIWFMAINLKNRILWLMTILVGVFSIIVFWAIPGLTNRLFSIYSFTSITNAQRLDLWRNSIKMIPQSPIFGIGMNMFPIHYHNMNHSPLIPLANHAHNNFLNILVEFGIIGFIIWILLVMGIFLYCYRVVKDTNNPIQHCLGKVIIGWLISLLVHGMTDYTIAMRFPMILFMFLLGLLVAMNNETKIYNGSKFWQSITLINPFQIRPNIKG